MNGVRSAIVIVLVTFFSSNLFSAELTVKSSPTLSVKEPVTTVVKQPVLAPTTSTTSPAISIKEPVTNIAIKAPAPTTVKEPTLAPAVKTPTTSITIKEPTLAPTVRSPAVAPAIREPMVKSPATIQVQEPAAGLKDPSLMGVRGEQMLDGGKLDAMGGRNLDALGGKDLGAFGGKGIDLTDPASALGVGRPGGGMDRNSLGAQFGLGGTQNPKGAPTLGGKSVDNPLEGLGRSPGSSMMDGDSTSGGSGEWSGRTEWTDKQSSKNGEESTDIRGREFYEMEDGSTLEVITDWNSEEGGSQQAIMRDADGNVIAEETTDLEPSTDAGSSGNDSNDGNSTDDNQDVDTSGDYTAGNGSSDEGNSGASDNGNSGGGNVETNAQPSQQGTATTPNPEGGGGDGSLPPEMQAMVNRMLMRAGTTQVDKKSTLIDPGSDAQSTTRNALKGELSDERLNPYINPDPDGGNEVVSGGENVNVGNPGGTLVNPGGNMPLSTGPSQ